MKVVIRKRAYNAFVRIALYIESINSPGSGDRWLDKVREKINELAKLNVKWPLCRHLSLAKYKYSCYTYKDWVIVFRVNSNELEVCRFIYGARLH